MAPGPSAWRLNRAEQQGVLTQLDAWKAANADRPEEEFQRMMEEEKRRLTRIVQEEKHGRNMEKQAAAKANAGAKSGKGKGKAKAAAKAAAANAAAAVDPSNGSTVDEVNREYYQSLSTDLQVIRAHLGDISAEQPEPIASAADALGGVQAGFGL